MKKDAIFEETRNITDEDIVDMARRAAEIKHNISALEAKLGVFKKATSECVSTLKEEMDRLLRQINSGTVELYENDFEDERSRIVTAKRPMGVQAAQLSDGTFVVEFGKGE